MDQDARLPPGFDGSQRLIRKNQREKNQGAKNAVPAPCGVARVLLYSCQLAILPRGMQDRTIVSTAECGGRMTMDE